MQLYQSTAVKFFPLFKPNGSGPVSGIRGTPKFWSSESEPVHLQSKKSFRQQIELGDFLKNMFEISNKLKISKSKFEN